MKRWILLLAATGCWGQQPTLEALKKEALAGVEARQKMVQ